MYYYYFQTLANESLVKGIELMIAGAMLELLTVYNSVFYFAVALLVFTILVAAWRSTYIPGQQHITVVVWQHSSGRQTFQRFASADDFDATSLVPPASTAAQNVDLDTANEDLDVDEVESDEDGIIDDIVNVVNETVQANAVSLTQINDAIATSLSNSGLSAVNRTATALPSASTLQTSIALASTSSQAQEGISLSADNFIIETSRNIIMSDMISNPGNLTSSSMNSSSVPDVSATSHPGSAISDHETRSTDTNSVSNSVYVTAVNNSVTVAESVSSTSTSNEASSEPSLVTANNLPVASSELTNSDTCCDVNSNSNKNSIQQETEINVNTKSSGVSSTSEIPCPAGSIRIRLKFLDDQQRIVFGKPADNILRFKTLVITFLSHIFLSSVIIKLSSI